MSDTKTLYKLAPLTETMLVRMALIRLKQALDDKSRIYGGSNFYTVKMMLSDKENLGLNLIQFGKLIMDKPIAEWANMIPSWRHLCRGEPIKGGTYETYYGVGMCGFLSKRSDDRVQLTLQVFDE